MKKRIPFAAAAALLVALALFIQVPAQSLALLAEQEATESMPVAESTPEEGAPETPDAPGEPEENESTSLPEVTEPPATSEAGPPPSDSGEELEGTAPEEQNTEESGPAVEGPETPTEKDTTEDKTETEADSQTQPGAAAFSLEDLLDITPNSIITGSQTVASLFPDTLLASYTAGLLGVGVNTPVTQNQLNSIQVFNPTGAVHNVEGIQYLNGVREMRLDNLQLTERFPQAYLNDVHPNLSYYIANNQRFEHPLITIYDKTLQSIAPNIPPLFGQIAENSGGAVVGRWTVRNQNYGEIYSVNAVNGSELEAEIEAITPGRYTLELQLYGGVWMGLDNSLYYFPFEYVADAAGSISGTVTDQNGNPVGGVTITLSDGKTVTTAADGTYSIASLDAGNYTVGAAKTGYSSQSKSATVNAGQNTVVNFQLAQLTGAVAGTVLDLETGRPIPGATVTLTTYPGFAFVDDVTTPDGNYQFNNLTPGTYAVRGEADAAGYNPETVLSIPAGNNETTVADIYLGKIAYYITGTVYEAGTNQTVTIEGATVTLPNGETVTTDENGEYTSGTRRFVPGTYSMLATAPLHGSDIEQVVIANANAVRDFELEPDPGFYVITTYENAVAEENRLPGVQLTITYPDGDTATVTTGSPSGSYTFQLPPEDYTGYTVTAAMEGYTVEPENGFTGTLLAPDETVYDNFVLTPIAARVYGVVRDGSNGNAPMAGVTVTLSDGRTAVTNAQGEYEFLNTPYGEYTVSATAQDYGSDSHMVSVTEPGDVEQDLTLYLLPGTVTVEVRYFTTDQPVVGATVNLSGGRTGTTGPDGTVQFTPLNPGDYTATASKDGFTSQPGTGTLPADGEVIIPLRLYQVPALTGFVSGGYFNIPLPGATLTLTSLDGATTIATAITDGDGYYDMQDLPQGSYRLTVTADGYESTARNVTLRAGEVTYASFILTPSLGTLNGTVTYRNGTPVPGVEIDLLEPGTNTVLRTATTNDQGEYIFWLAPGEYDVLETVDMQEEYEQEVEALSSTIVDFVLDTPPGYLVGRVTNEANQPIEGATITAWAPGFPQLATTTDADGNYAFDDEPVEPAEYTITASLPGEYASQTKIDVVREGETTTVNFQLAGLPGGIHGYATYAPTGEPIPGVSITLAPDGLSVTTDANGYYSFVLTAGTYTVTADNGYEQQQEPDVVVPDGATLVEVDFEFDTAPGTLRGTATDQNGAPLAGVEITANDGGTARLVLTATTAADGTYAFTGIDPATYTVNASLAGYDADGPKTGTVAPLGTATVNFTLTARDESTSGGGSSSDGSSSGGDGSSSSSSSTPGGTGSTSSGSGASGSGTGGAANGGGTGGTVSGSAGGTGGAANGGGTGGTVSGSAGGRIARTADYSRTGLFLSIAVLALLALAMFAYKRKRGRN